MICVKTNMMKMWWNFCTWWPIIQKKKVYHLSFVDYQHCCFMEGDMWYADKTCSYHMARARLETRCTFASCVDDDYQCDTKTKTHSHHMTRARLETRRTSASCFDDDYQCETQTRRTFWSPRNIFMKTHRWNPSTRRTASAFCVDDNYGSMIHEMRMIRRQDAYDSCTPRDTTHSICVVCWRWLWINDSQNEHETLTRCIVMIRLMHA